MIRVWVWDCSTTWLGSWRLVMFPCLVIFDGLYKLETVQWSPSGFVYSFHMEWAALRINQLELVFLPKSVDSWPAIIAIECTQSLIGSLLGAELNHCFGHLAYCNGTPESKLKPSCNVLQTLFENSHSRNRCELDSSLCVHLRQQGLMLQPLLKSAALFGHAFWQILQRKN